MKIKFESELQFQLDAMNSIVEIFKGSEKHDSTFTVYSPEYINNQQTITFNEIGYSNQINLSREQLIENTINIQLKNGLKPSSVDDVREDNLEFSIEMETGTGKTYVYLRTIMELYQKYGLSKFIIVVPSISIKEGVYKSLQITQDHYRQLYDNIQYNYFIYNSGRLSDVRNFSANNGLEIMVINIDAFSKSFKYSAQPNKANIIHRYHDSLGGKPLDFIRNTRPVVIIDEPQSTISTPLRKTAVQNLNPLVTLRYSATHREKVNLVFKLDAVDAYAQKLVKQIEVGSVQASEDRNNVYIKLKEVILSKGLPIAKVEVDVFERGSVKRKIKKVRQNTDLEEITKRNEYEGYIIKDIYGEKGNEYIDFTSREDVIKLHESIGEADELQIKRVMISKTIEEHLDKEMILNKKGIKVLSLFFIDRVMNYRGYDDEGNPTKGIYAKIFEEEYKKHIRKPKYNTPFGKLKESNIDIQSVHDGYFSIDKKGKRSNSKEKYEYFKDTSGNTNADENTYHLIMRDKEKLLSFDSNIRFIFSHSALKEGWDNPNVFQICTLRQKGKSKITPRQQIGRGLRLCVNQNGERIFGHGINTLSVIANESWEQFVQDLQKEIEKESGIVFGEIKESTFSDIVIKPVNVDKNPIYMGHEKSKQLFKYLLDRGYIDSNGRVMDLLNIALFNNNVEIPESFHKNKEYIKKQIINKLKSFASKLPINNLDKKKKVKINEKIIECPDFQELWERVKHKTTFSVNFDSHSLIKKCIDSIDKHLKKNKGRIVYERKHVVFDVGGLDVDESKTKTQDYIYENQVENLPDIISYIQNATNLTRQSIVKILTDTRKLEYFKINPQKFIEGCIDLINEQMRHHIVDGLKYHKMGRGEFYSQELFKNEELFGYLKRNMIESSKSPYDYVIYDSAIERSLTNDFENSENVSVYAKLPSWFRIQTPLGSYNPDWVVNWKEEDGEEKLFFVVESKGHLFEENLRRIESSKINCGKKHFEELGSELRVGTRFSDITTN